MLRTCRLAHLCVCVCVCVCLSVCLCVWKVYCGKMAERIRIPLGMVSAVGHTMGIVDTNRRILYFTLLTSYAYMCSFSHSRVMIGAPEFKIGHVM